MPRTHLKPLKTLRFLAPSTRSLSICKPKISFFLKRAKGKTSQTLIKKPTTAQSSNSLAPHRTKMQTLKAHTWFLARLTPQSESSATQSGEASLANQTGTPIRGTCTLTKLAQAWTSRSLRPVSNLPFSQNTSFSMLRCGSFLSWQLRLCHLRFFNQTRQT